MEHQIIVVGIGPGSPDYLLPVARKAIDTAAVIVGSRRALTAFAPPSAQQRVIDGDIDAVLEFIANKQKSTAVVVMVSGDPGYYSLLAALRKSFTPQQLTVLPGVSSFQIAFARLALPWQDADLISMHGRQPEKALLQYRPDKVLGILTDSVYQPGRIARLLLETGWPGETTVWVCAALSYPEEKIICSDLTETASLEGFGHCVMVVKA